ncbi:MAG: hypothetical protein A3C06_03995 [Candidatus Taylorbacteria bacterium RIFCSPHIGHO2_02_FULL_46_13]|uniref:Uncharacterized protein n=1 Tax=Candidatus Taylorbacteria bacterium RIFCSPHIGHO2_02_FULL_46_13 TaxID=1802312 RepID=A0A1G2MTM8_9BACT|nr:MAG: hypothetical protein A3C06_03995 [Candidatus Taylorbacteria bacterium RIFCSPHIGHO2_02_FULL_46_13]
MYVKIKVVASAPKEHFTKVGEDVFEVWVLEPAKQGQANRRVLELVRTHFGPRTSVRIVSGHHSPSKIVSVETHA